MIRFKVTSEEELEHVRKQIGELDLSKAWEVEVKPFAFNRSVQQNRRYWKLIQELGSYLGYDEGTVESVSGESCIGDSGKSLFQMLI